MGDDAASSIDRVKSENPLEARVVLLGSQAGDYLTRLRSKSLYSYTSNTQMCETFNFIRSVCISDRCDDVHRGCFDRTIVLVLDDSGSSQKKLNELCDPLLTAVTVNYNQPFVGPIAHSKLACEIRIANFTNNEW
jgi:hypothetical protein